METVKCFLLSAHIVQVKVKQPSVIVLICIIKRDKAVLQIKRHCIGVGIYG